MFNKNQLEKYFQRIGLDYRTFEGLPLDFSMLCQLQYAHVITVPYENLDILKGIPLSLAPDALYQKIIVNHRGGYCFELNGLYGALLRSLGFGVTDCFARYLRDEPAIPKRRHRVLMVEAEDGKFLCDIGIGQPAPRHPVRMARGLRQSQFGEAYKFEKEDFLGWVLYDLYKGEWRKFFSFTEEPQLDIDYVCASAWCELHPDSPFNKAEIIAVKTGDGRKTLDGRTFKIFAGGSVTVKENLSESEMEATLSEHFGIHSRPSA
jgi:N-hydroxyarylamine O-acetyltransferase